MELLIVKTGKEYIRVKPDGFHVVGLDKASVFPVDQLQKVREYEGRLNDQGFAEVCVKKLVISEENLSNE